MVPALLLVVVLLVVPMLENLYYSFTSWNGISAPVFTGFKNYFNLFADPDFLVSVRNTLLWVVFTLVFPVTGGLLVAVFVEGIALERLFKSIFYIPLTISFVATGIIWTYMFSKELGVVNGTFALFGLGMIKPSWLTDVPLNTFSLLIAWTWQQLGTNMVMFLMGLSTIPTEPIEASILDGANRFQTFIFVKLPMLRPITTVVITMAMVNSFKAFDIIYVMTRGGPYYSSETLAVTMFRETFTMFKMGYGASISVVLSIVVIAVSTIYIKRMAAKDLLYY